MLKRLSLAAKVSLLTSGLVAASTLADIKLPNVLAEQLLKKVSPQLAIESGDIFFNWRKGRLLANDLVISDHGEAVASSKSLKLVVDLNPASKGFLTPSIINIESSQFDIDADLYQALINIPVADSSIHALQVNLRDLDLKLNLGPESITEISGIDADASFNSLIGTLHIVGNMVYPAAGRISLDAHSIESHQHWRAYSSANLKLDKTLNIGLSYSSASLGLTAAASGDWNGAFQWSTLGDVSIAEPRLSDPQLSFNDSHIKFAGDSQNGVEINGVSTFLDHQVQSRGEFNLGDHEGPSLYLSHDLNSVEISDELRNWLAAIEPEIADYLVATAATGKVSAHAITEYLANNFSWSTTIFPQQLKLSYQGLSDSPDNHFSFPYPFEVSSGYIIASSDELVFNIGSEQSQSQLRVIGDLDFVPHETAIDLNLHASKLPLGPQVYHALAGNPKLSKLLRDLGSPDGGTANADIRLFTDNDNAEFKYLVNLSLGQCNSVPVMLPLEVAIDIATATITENLVLFNAEASAAQSQLNISGSAHEIENAGGTEVRVTTSATGWHPSAEESKIMSSYLPIPAGLASFPIDGGFSYTLQLLWPDTDSDVHLAADLVATEASVAWPQLGVEMKSLSCENASLFSTNDLFKFNAGEIAANINGGLIRGFSFISHNQDSSFATGKFTQLPLSNELIMGSQEFGGQEVWGDHLNWDGIANGIINFNPLNPELFSGSIEMSTLSISPKSNPEATFAIRGTAELSPNQVKAERLVLQSPQSELIIHQILGDLNSEGLRVTAILESNTGVLLDQNLPALAGSDFGDSIATLGLEGEIFADGLKVESTINRDGQIAAEFTGDMFIQKLHMNNALALSNGSADVLIKDAWWNSADDFGANIRISNGSGLLNRMKLENANSDVTIDTAHLSCKNLDADLLQGKIIGNLQVGFSVDTPIAVNAEVTDIDLGVMRQQLDIDGALSGKVSGLIDINSPTPSPTFCQGKINLNIRDGVLGSVPVMKTIWKIIGIPAPVIDEGQLDLKLPGNGEITVNSFSLDGAAFEFTGKGVAYMDSTIDLKVTARTLGLITRLPLLKDLLDVFIEQQIYGPVNDLQITHRAWAKITNNDFDRPPFPLWVPTPKTPSWNISPVIPVQ
ncbi:MAG: hypothetical protein QGF46_01200 [Planctomycetota bacterium]|jgi:hypothetical protein|nr:hypothetical protein [Planctomycetota bacterium]